VTRYLLSPEAKADIVEIRSYLVSEGGMRLVRYILHEMVEAFRLLAANPGAGHRREDLTSLPVKFWPVFSYLVVYQVAEPLAIVRVLHGGRDAAAILKRDE